METDKTDSHPGSRVSGPVMVAALLVAMVGAYLYYQNSGGPDANSERQKPPATAGTTTPGTTADAASKPRAQDVATAANPPAPPANQSGRTPAAPANNAPSAPPQQNQADRRAAPAAGDTASKPAAGTADNAQFKSASLPTPEIAYVQKSRANIRAEPSKRGKRIGKAPKGTKLTVLGRAGKWVQVESGETKGWIGARLLGPRSP
jgi:hypothetical protein